GTARAAICSGEPGGGGRHDRDRSGSQGATRWYTLLFASPGKTIGASLYDKLNYNFIRDTPPVAKIAADSGGMEVHPSVPAMSVADLITYAKANPGKISMASAGNGTFQHVSGELFKMMAGVDMVHVPYRGAGPALIDMVGGQVQIMFDTLPSSI